MEEIYAHIQSMATQQEHTPRGETTGEHGIMSAEIEIEIDRLKNTTNHITHRRLELVKPTGECKSRSLVTRKP